MPHMDEGTLHAFLDGELEKPEERRLHEHLATCADCRAGLDTARATRARAHEILRLADPPLVESPPFASIAARGSGQGRLGSVRREGRAYLLPWAASVVLAVGAGWFAQKVVSGGGEPRVTAGELAAGSGAAATVAEADDPPMAAALPSPEQARALAAGPATSHGREGDEEAPRALAAGHTETAELAKEVAEATLFGGEEWRPTDRQTATTALGSVPPLVPGLEVESYALATAQGGPVRVAQRLPGGETLLLVQRSSGDQTRQSEGAVSADAAGELVVVRSGGLEIELHAPIPIDSLRSLAKRLQR